MVSCHAQPGAGARFISGLILPTGLMPIESDQAWRPEISDPTQLVPAASGLYWVTIPDKRAGRTIQILLFLHAVLSNLDHMIIIMNTITMIMMINNDNNRDNCMVGIDKRS